MKKTIDSLSLSVVREYLDEVLYALVDLRLSFEVERRPEGFADFASLKMAVKRLDPVHQVLFQLFRLGEPVTDASLRKAVPDRVFRALVDTELLVRDEAGEWRTPSLLLLPVKGMFLFVSIPSSYPTATGPYSYPTATKPYSTWFDTASIIIARALPSSLAGRRVLDVCSGSGLQALLCAARGATQVIGLELVEEAVLTARVNAALNGLDGKVEFRSSNMLASLQDGERFDFIVCNTPYAPVIEGPHAPATLDAVGNSVLWRLLDRLPAHLSDRGRGIMGVWRALGVQSSTYVMQAIASRLEKEGLSVFANSNRALETNDDILRILQDDLEKRPEMPRARVEEIVKSVRQMLEQPSLPVDGFYNQIIYFQKGRIESAATERAIFGLIHPHAEIS